jgi:hypothetical protein
MLVAVRPGMFMAISVIVMILMITASCGAGLTRLMVGRQLIMAVRLAHKPIMIMIPCTRVMV